MKKSRFELDEIHPNARALTGIDEVGRGCLAGPVVVAAVTWKPWHSAVAPCLVKLNDSKQLSAKTREELYPKILACADRIRLAVIAPPVIDRLNILRATLHGFELVAPSFQEGIPLIIDGNQRPISLKWAMTAVKGDARSSPVAAAAIIAKVFRDALMTGLETDFPGYGFAAHKGYATAVHREGITRHGACRHHRKSFRPVKDLVAQEAAADDILPARLAHASEEEAAALWVEFCNRYQNYSHKGARLAMAAFQECGLGLLPRPGETPECAVN